MKNITNIWTIMVLLLCTEFFAVSCGDDEKAIVISDDWVTVSTNLMTVGCEGGTLMRDYTLAEGLDASVVYIVSSESWCSAYIEEGKIVVDVAESDDINGRTAKMFLIYDENHQVELTVEQGKAEVVLVESIDKSAVPETVNINETLDLNALVNVLPANASYKNLVFTIVDGNDFIELSDAGIVKGLNVGTAHIKVTAVDDSGVTDVITLQVAGTIKLDRTSWAVSTYVTYASGQNYVPDGTTGKPEDILDGNDKTFLAMVRPTKSYNTAGNTYTAPLGENLSFTVNMKEVQTFNFFYWQHRNKNTSAFQVLSLNIYGSNDNQNFTRINTAPIAIAENVYTEQILDIPESTYQYVKIEYLSFSTGGTTIQVVEFGLGLKLSSDR